jgi:hypothetical protein
VAVVTGSKREIARFLTPQKTMHPGTSPIFYKGGEIIDGTLGVKDHLTGLL